MKLKRGTTSKLRLIFIADSSSTTGAGLANLTYNSAGLVAYYYANDLNNELQITLATMTLGTWASGGFVAVDNTNMPGWYQIGIPDAALDGGDEGCIQLRGATNMVPVNVYIELDAVDYQTDAFGALKPTTAGRTLDVSTGGEAGIDWANVGSPTTSLALTGTTIATTQKVDLETIKTQAVVCSAGTTIGAYTGNATAPVAVDGSGHVTVGTMSTGVITANSIAADAITDAKVASDVTIASVTGAVGSVAGNVGGNVVGSVASVTAGVTVTTNNDKTGYALSSAGVQAIWDALTSALTTVGSIGKRIVDYLTGDAYTRLGAPAGVSVSADIANIQSDTDNIQTRLPAALTADGNIKADTLRVNGTAQTAGDLAALITAVDDYIDTEVAAIKAKTDQLTFTVANRVDATATATLSAGDIEDIGQAIADDLSTANAEIVVTSPVAVGRILSITTGDDYSGTTRIAFTLTGRTDLVGLIPHLYLKSGETITAETTAVVSGTETIYFTVLSDDTETLTGGTVDRPATGEYQIKFVTTGGLVTTVVNGTLLVTEGLTV